MATNLEHLVESAKTGFPLADEGLVRDIIQNSHSGAIEGVLTGAYIQNLDHGERFGVKMQSGDSIRNVAVGADTEYRSQKVTGTLAKGITAYATAMQDATQTLDAARTGLISQLGTSDSSSTISASDVASFVHENRIYQVDRTLYSLIQFEEEDGVSSFAAGRALRTGKVIEKLLGNDSGHETGIFDLAALRARADEEEVGEQYVGPATGPSPLEDSSIQVAEEYGSTEFELLSPLGFLDELHTEVQAYNARHHSSDSFIPVRMDQLRRVLGIAEGADRGAHNYAIASDKTGLKVYGPRFFSGAPLAKIVTLTGALAKADARFQEEAEEVFDKMLGPDTLYTQEGDDALAFAKQRGIRFSYSLKGVMSPTGNWKADLEHAIDTEVQTRQQSQDAKLLPGIISALKAQTAADIQEKESYIDELTAHSAAEAERRESHIEDLQAYGEQMRGHVGRLESELAEARKAALYGEINQSAIADLTAERTAHARTKWALGQVSTQYNALLRSSENQTGLIDEMQGEVADWRGAVPGTRTPADATAVISGYKSQISALESDLEAQTNAADAALSRANAATDRAGEYVAAARNSLGITGQVSPDIVRERYDNIVRQRDHAVTAFGSNATYDAEAPGEITPFIAADNQIDF